MKVIVLGAGVIGVTTAYYLNEAGHEVVVYDRQAGPAMETSFGNAGEISPGYSSPWAGPGMPLKAIKWLLMRHGPLVRAAQAGPRDVVMDVQDAAQLHGRPLCRQQVAHGAARGVQPRLPAGAARGDRHQLRRA